MIVLDANILVAYWSTDDAHADAAFEVLDTEDDLVLHPATLAETLVWPVRRSEEQAALTDLTRLGIERHEPLPDEPLNVARLRAETRLKLPDAYVLATAIAHEATLATLDARLASAARARSVAVIGIPTASGPSR
ncbi:PIN domain-containing protein [Microbacterium sp. KUDC0406]|uniref:type II toxin-antitoxin system VapC family toxin n=1 Tax=Microbacterium sp. KUDC0406 TaxID=2909588 RepID=UPI001F221B66|nr:PIN domain-containing protein [Microbacterium sp. KUDC0406]UJP11013.1 PIN domain-containing protein [Microbacterium sp. KUDC0406]